MTICDATAKIIADDLKINNIPKVNDAGFVLNFKYIGGVNHKGHLERNTK